MVLCVVRYYRRRYRYDYAGWLIFWSDGVF